MFKLLCKCLKKTDVIMSLRTIYISEHAIVFLIKFSLINKINPINGPINGLSPSLVMRIITIRIFHLCHLYSIFTWLILCMITASTDRKLWISL